MTDLLLRIKDDMSQHSAAPTPTPTSAVAVAKRRDWWRDAVIYQVYPRSFADSNGDGMGDLEGVRTRLPYLRDLGVDAVWLSPFYASPQADAGYDVADYRAVDPMFGNLLDADALIRDAHRLSLRIIVDLVPNHSSDQHEWFKRAVAEGPGSALRERYHFRPGKGENGELPPNDWESIFGGPAWTRVTEPDGTPGEWYLHLFAPEQPDFNWEHPAVGDEFRSILRFWLDMGVDGFRIDVAHGLVKAQGLPDLGSHDQVKLLGNDVMPFFDQDGVHEIYRQWRLILDEYSPKHSVQGYPRAHLRRRGLDPDHRADRALRPPRRAAPGLQLPVPQHPLGRRGDARGHRPHPGRHASGRRPRHLGAVQPRRDPARHPLRQPARPRHPDPPGRRP